MRIWHEKLIPKLCQKHLCAMWREGLGAYKILLEGKKGYSKHPAVLEFTNRPMYLRDRLSMVREEMLARGYHPKEMPTYPPADKPWYSGNYFGLPTGKEWQTLEQQVEILKEKKCKCRV